MVASYLKQDVLLSCHEVLDSVRSSNLHFSCQEIPYSLYITIRKTLVNAQHVPAIPIKIDEMNDKLVKPVIEDNVALDKELEGLKSELEASHSIAKELEDKMDDAESKLFKHFKEVKQLRDKHSDEVNTIKNVIKNNKSEKDTIKSEISNLKKLSKSKDKDIYNLGNKISNLQDTVAKLKADSGKFKEEKNNFEKEIKKLKKKIEKSEVNTNINLKPILHSVSIQNVSSSPQTQPETSFQKPSSAEADTLSLTPQSKLISLKNMIPNYLNSKMPHKASPTFSSQTSTAATASSGLPPSSALSPDSSNSSLPYFIWPSNTKSPARSRSPHTPPGKPPPSASTAQPVSTSQFCSSLVTPAQAFGSPLDSTDSARPGMSKSEIEDKFILDLVLEGILVKMTDRHNYIMISILLS